MVHILLFDTYPRLGRRTEVDDHVPSIEIGEYLDHKKIFCGGSDSQSSHLLASQPIRLSRMAPFDLSSRLMNHILTNVRFFSCLISTNYPDIRIHRPCQPVCQIREHSRLTLDGIQPVLGATYLSLSSK